SSQVRGHVADEPVCRPDSVGASHPAAICLGAPLPMRSGNLPAGSASSVDTCAGTALGSCPLGLAPGGVYLAAPVTRGAGGLLHHPFTLTRTAYPLVHGRWRSPFCGTVPHVTVGGCYPPPRSVESGPSSVGLASPTRPPDRLVRCVQS